MHPNSVERLPFTLTESSVLAVIPARYHSTRFPGKILADIAGRPMIEHVYRRASAARLVHAVIVATDDERIAAAVRGFGGAAIMTRADHVSGTDRIAEVVAAHPCRAVVNVQGDEPLIEPETIDAAVKPLLDDSTIEMSTLSRPFIDIDEFRNPHVVKVVTDDRGHALYFSRSPIPFPRGAALPAPARAHVGLYVYRRETLLKLAAACRPHRWRSSSRSSSCARSPTASAFASSRPITRGRRRYARRSRTRSPDDDWLSSRT